MNVKQIENEGSPARNMVAVVQEKITIIDSNFNAPADRLLNGIPDTIGKEILTSTQASIMEQITVT